MEQTSDITGLVISVNEMMGKLNDILADSVILDLSLDITGLGRDVEAMIGVASEQLRGENFTKLCVDTTIRQQVEDHLRLGYFNGLETEILTCHGEPVNVSLSGFYLGLISDINGYVILKVKQKEDGSTPRTESFRKRELDTFIYRAAHDLRGPLATIKGLVNLLKHRTSDREVDELTNLIEVHANKLDDRLFKLIYLANDQGQGEDTKGCIDFNVLKGVILKTLEDNYQLEKTVLGFHAPASTLCQVNDRAIMRLVRHIVLHIVSLPVASATGQNQTLIDTQVRVIKDTLQIKIKAQGFLTSESVRVVMQQPSSLYSDLLSHPLLFNYYVASKEVKLLRGAMRVEFTATSDQIFEVTMPVEVNPLKAIL